MNTLKFPRIFLYFKFEHNFDRLCYHRPPRSTNPSFGWLAMNSFICSMHFWVGQKIVTESEGFERVSLCDVIATRLLDPILVDDESNWLCLLLSFSVLGLNGKVSAMTHRLSNKITTQWYDTEVIFTDFWNNKKKFIFFSHRYSAASMLMHKCRSLQ